MKTNEQRINEKRERLQKYSKELIELRGLILDPNTTSEDRARYLHRYESSAMFYGDCQRQISDLEFRISRSTK